MNRWWILGPALAVMGWLVLTDSHDASLNSVSASVERGAVANSAARSLPPPRTATPSAAKTMAAPVRPLQSRQDLYGPDSASKGQPTLFTARSWTEPVAPVVNKGPVVEEAPAFPYAVVGRKKEGSAMEVFLSRDDQNFVAREGQALETDYKVTRIGPNSMTVVYTRLNHAHEIPLGDME
jgi:hypothetical protein